MVWQPAACTNTAVRAVPRSHAGLTSAPHPTQHQTFGTDESRDLKESVWICNDSPNKALSRCFRRTFRFAWRVIWTCRQQPQVFILTENTFLTSDSFTHPSFPPRFLWLRDLENVAVRKTAAVVSEVTETQLWCAADWGFFSSFFKKLLL